MSSDGYNHFLVNPSGLIVGGPPASTPAAAPESAIQRLLGGAPELLDRISEQAADMSFRDPLDMSHHHISHLHLNSYTNVDGHFRAFGSGPHFRWWETHGKSTYLTMVLNVLNKVWDCYKLYDFSHNIEAKRLINEARMDLKHSMEKRDKTYNEMYGKWKILRGLMLNLLEDNRSSQYRIMIKWVVKEVEGTFESMRELLLSMHPLASNINPDALLNLKYVDKRDLTKRILNGKPHTPSQ